MEGFGLERCKQASSVELGKCSGDTMRSEELGSYTSVSGISESHSVCDFNYSVSHMCNWSSVQGIKDAGMCIF